MLLSFIPNTIIGYGACSLTYNLLKKFKVNDINSQSVLSLIHAFGVNTSSIFYLTNNLTEESWYSLCGLSAGYAIFDTYLYLYKFSLINKEMIFHHSLMIAFSFYPTLVNFNIVPYIPVYMNVIPAMYLSEISTIPLNISYLCIKNNYTKSKIFKYSNYALITTFFIFRILNFTYLNSIVYKDCNKLISTLMITFTGLNYVWFYKLIKKAQAATEKDN